MTNRENGQRQGDLIIYGLIEELKKHMEEREISYNELSRLTKGEISKSTVSRTLTHSTLFPPFGVVYELYKALNIELTIVPVVHEVKEENGEDA